MDFFEVGGGDVLNIPKTYIKGIFGIFGRFFGTFGDGSCVPLVASGRAERFFCLTGSADGAAGQTERIVPFFQENSW